MDSTLNSLLRITAGMLVTVAATLLQGCATVPADSGNDPRDPVESLNRHVFEFNEVVDRAFLKPVAQVYRDVLPDPVRDCISNVFSNFREPSNAVNNLLQGKPVDAVSDTSRFVVNSTIGLLGCFDPARQMGLEKSNEDFGQTLGRWGAGAGPFLVVPIIGPSSVRDAIALFGVEPYLDVNFYIDNVRVRNSILGTRIVNQRSELLQTDDLISGAALDKYRFIRDGYLQRRRSLIYDGNPPPAAADPDSQASPGGAPQGDSSVNKEPVPAQSGTPAPK